MENDDTEHLVREQSPLLAVLLRYDCARSVLLHPASWAPTRVRSARADLTRLDLWNSDLKNEMVAANGSVMALDIPDNLKDVYKTVWEIKQKVLVEMAADRGAFIDQSQSFNVHMSDPNFGKLTSLHFYAWRLGLKTGMYYLRTRAAADAIKFTVDQQALKKNQVRQWEG